MRATGARPHTGLALAAGALVWAAGALAAPDPAPDLEWNVDLPTSDADEASEGELLEQWAELVGPDLFEGIAGDERELLALMAMQAGEWVRARELAETMLAEDAESIAGNCVLGQAQAVAEGNLALALYHFRRCRDLFVARYGDPDDTDPWMWHRIALEGLAATANTMGRFEESLAHIDELDEHYAGDFRSMRCWPLVNLGRLEEARALAEEVLETAEDPEHRVVAWNAICVAAGEERDTEAAHEACNRALELAREEDPDPVRFTNAAESAQGVLRMDEAERLLLEATAHFELGSPAMPWMELVHLYIDQGRAAEALGAMREMFAWRRRQPPYVDVQNWAVQDLASATLLIVAGRPVEASHLTGRALERPDRLGGNSVDADQMAAAAALIDRVANLAAAQLRAEEASWSDFLWDGLRARASQVRHRIRAWRSGRAAVARFSNWRLLSSRVQPHAPGFARIPEWIDSDLIELLGPGVMAGALERARAAGLVTGEHGYDQAMAAEIALLRSLDRQALDTAEDALSRLPRVEALLRARVELVAALAASALSEDARALAHYDAVLQLDPGVVRRQGAAIPVHIEVSGGDAAHAAARLLEGSPRLDVVEGGFAVRVEDRAVETVACLSGPFGTVHGCARVQPRAGEDAGAMGRRLARRFHEVTFAPRIDLTQADIRSLDGSNAVASERGGERLRIVLDDMLGGESDGPGDRPAHDSKRSSGARPSGAR